MSSSPEEPKLSNSGSELSLEEMKKLAKVRPISEFLNTNERNRLKFLKWRNQRTPLEFDRPDPDIDQTPEAAVHNLPLTNTLPILAEGEHPKFDPTDENLSDLRLKVNQVFYSLFDTLTRNNSWQDSDGQGGMYYTHSSFVDKKTSCSYIS